MATLRTAYFRPQSGSVDLYVSEDGFNRSEPVTLAALPADMQQIASAAMQWLSGQMPEDVSLSLVILTRLPAQPVAWDADGNATQFSPAFSISATGAGSKGETALELHSRPGELTNWVAALWDYLETQV